MTAVAGGVRIVCPVGIFQAQEHDMRDLTDALNRAANLPEKMAFATRLQAAAEDLLACADRQADNINCRLCQEFSRLRANTAGLILRAARLPS